MKTKQVKMMVVKMNRKGEKEALDSFKNEKVIAQGENYLTRFYEVFNGCELEDGELIKDIIKVQLDSKRGYNQLLKGIKYNGCTYKELVTTPSGQKQEGDDFKGESIFYNVDTIPNFKEEFCKVISADKLSELNGKEISINKMISSRLALSTSTIEGAIDIDVRKIFVADEHTYDYINKYAWFEDGKLIEGERSVTHTFSDGQGLMSSEIADRIAKELDKSKVDFAVVRLYHGLAVKGVLLRFDFKKYYEQFGIEYLRDIYGKIWNINEIDIIVNPSMVKWLGLHENIDDTINFYKDSKYADINNKLYITKTNKEEDKIKDYLKLNYQALLNMNLSFEDLKELAKDEVTSYKSITSFNDVDMIRLALGCEDETDSLLGLTIDKLGAEALSLSYIRLLTKSTLEKQIKQLSGGKIRANGGYKIIATDPVAFCNRLINHQSADELQAGEFIVANETGERCIYRSPIAVYSEIHRIELTQRDWAKGYTKELIFVNEKDDMLMLSSGAK